jgi:threonine/homoserine/homoserine lactone efflux protein
MDLSLFLRGLLIGFSIAAPVGPIGILCIRRTLAEGRASGFLSGLGAATADALYGCVAGFGLTVVSAFLVDQRAWIQLIGGVFLLALGVRTLRSKPAERAAQASAGRGLAGSYLSTLLLTLTNPMTIISFAGIFAALGVAETGGSLAEAAWLVAGVFAGSAAWWLLLSGGVGLMRDRIASGVLLWVNRASGAVLLAFGAVAVWQAGG